MISALHIDKSFGTLKVLKDICFEAGKGEVVSIVGASGAGKSTLLQIIGSLSRPDSGRVTIDGTDIFALSSTELARFRNGKIGFVFQSNNLLPEFTALENVMIPALIGGASRKEASARAKELLVELGLGERLSHKPSALSGGEQQRVAVARALVNSPSVLFADEPSGNLDSRTKEDLHRLFFDLRDRYGVTIVIVTHDRELAAMSDRTLEMRDGRFITGAMSDTFRFKRFEVHNSASAQKVGTDGVLLGAWTSLPKGDEPRILDIGTGTGVIALMLAQRCAGARITGIDIDAPSVEEASLNFASSPWSGRLAASLSSVQQFEGGPFDLIVSNPPFFINSLKAPSCRRSAARHTDTLSHRELAASALRLLSAGGIFSVVYPPEEGEAFVFEAEGNGLHLVRKCEVCTMPGKGVKRVLLEFSRTASDHFSSEKMCIYTTLDTFSPEYVEILKDFYLKF